MIKGIFLSLGLCAAAALLVFTVAHIIGHDATTRTDWIEGRQLYAGWSEAVAVPPDQNITNDKGERLTHRAAGWVRWGVDDETQVGLRSDGVMVWRKVPKKK